MKELSATVQKTRLQINTIQGSIDATKKELADLYHQSEDITVERDALKGRIRKITDNPNVQAGGRWVLAFEHLSLFLLLNVVTLRYIFRLLILLKLPGELRLG
jgi:hypothetical protein